MQNNTRNIDTCTNRPTPTKLSQSHKPFLRNNYSHSIGSRNAVLKYKNISNMKTETYTLQVNTLNRTNLNAMSWKQIGENEPIFCTCSIEALEISCQTYKHTQRSLFYSNISVRSATYYQLPKIWKNAPPQKLTLKFIFVFLRP